MHANHTINTIKNIPKQTSIYLNHKQLITHKNKQTSVFNATTTTQLNGKYNQNQTIRNKQPQNKTHQKVTIIQNQNPKQTKTYT